jgi:predicted metal-binding protein
MLPPGITTRGGKVSEPLGQHGGDSFVLSDADVLASRYAGIAFLADKARDFGADAAAVMPADKVVVDERVRLKCAVPVCQGYGHYLHCPPNTFSVEEFRAVLARFAVALLVQVESPQTSVDLDEEGLAGKNAAELEALLHGEPNLRLLRVIGRLEAEAFKAGFYYASGFAGGICLLCPECVGVGSGKPCRHPYEARPSMEGVGIDVFKTAANAGLSISLSADEPVRWTGLLLVD